VAQQSCHGNVLVRVRPMNALTIAEEFEPGARLGAGGN
jgi:hypothetical protein